MAYRNRGKNVLSAIIAVMLFALVAVWQFYTFATFKDTNGILDKQGGTQHFWWAVAFGLLACAMAFLLFSVFLRHDTSNDTHITSPPSRTRLS